MSAKMNRPIRYFFLITALLCESALVMTLNVKDIAGHLTKLTDLRENFHEIILPGVNSGGGATEVDYPDPDYYGDPDFTGDGADSDSPLKENEINVLTSDLDNFDDISTLDDFIGRLGIPVPPPKIPSETDFDDFDFGTLSVRFGGNSNAIFDNRDNEVRYVENPVKAGCIPEPTTLDLPLDHTAGITYFPRCVRLNRCGGCCSNGNLRECQPVATTEVVYKVVKLEERSASSLRSNRARPRNPGRRGRRPNRRRREQRTTVEYQYLNVSMVEHSSCECQCKIRESDCTLPNQAYDASQCGCTCTNTDSESKCRSKRSSHFWDQKTCTCSCISKLECSHHQYFDDLTCQCTDRRGAANWEGN